MAMAQDFRETGKTQKRRGIAQRVVESDWFTAFVTGVIVLNAVTLGLATLKTLPPALHDAFRYVDQVVVAIFIFEIGLKLIAYNWRFFKSGWNVFDFLIVGVSLAPGAGAFSVLRALRVLRILRLISIVPMMRRIVEALLRAIPGMGAILAVLALMIYVGAVMATNMFGVSNPELFGSLPVSALTLFQVMTMDGWRNEILQPVMEAGNPYAWIFFLVFIVLASFAVLNLFMALIVDALNDDMEEALEEATDDLREGQIEAHHEREQLAELVAVMRGEVQELKKTVDLIRQTTGTNRPPPE